MELHSQQLSSKQKKDLQDWLKNPQADKLVEVLESRIFKMEAEAVTDLAGFMDVGTENESMIKRAKAKADDMRVHRLFINVLREIRDAASLEFYTATPTKTETGE